MAEGKITVQNFNTMLEKTQKEKEELKEKVTELKKQIKDETLSASYTEKWQKTIQEYADIKELDTATLNRLIKVIIINETIDDDKTRHISMEIHFNLKPLPETEQVCN